MSLRSNATPSPALTVHVNLWLEVNDQVVLSRWRVALLKAVDETGSIRAAAARMKVTYHLAWHRLDEMEAALGASLVVRHRGGSRGGSTQLTAAARDYVARFQQFAAEMDAEAERLFRKTFGAAEPAP